MTVLPRYTVYLELQWLSIDIQIHHQMSGELELCFDVGSNYATIRLDKNQARELLRKLAYALNIELEPKKVI